MNRLTRHAERRLSERAITRRALELHNWYADRSVPVGGGCESFFCSRGALHQMVKDGVSPQEAERALRLAVVVASDGDIVTAFPLTSGRRARRYRR